MLCSSLQSWKTTPSASKSRPARPGQKRIGPASENLKERLLDMYWDGVRDELRNILLTLHEWQTGLSTFSEPIPDEKDADSDLIQGYETFLKNVSYDPRLGHTIIASAGQASVRDNILAAEPIGLWQRRALMLLQSAQFLDIDKAFEHRPPRLDFHCWNLSLGKRLSPPQLNLEVAKNRPLFDAQRCSGCSFPIRSASYRHLREEDTILCETCFRKSSERASGQYRKHYKSCCLPSQLTRQEVAELCRCRTPHNDNIGKVGSRWPLAMKPRTNAELKGERSCWLFTLNRKIAESKHKGTYETILESKSLQKIKGLDKKRLEKMNRTRKSTGRTEKLPNLNSEFGSPDDFDTSWGKTCPVEQVPLYLRSHKKNYPFGNAHVALRFGPLTFENGVPSTTGVIISTRDLSELQVTRRAPPRNSLMLTERNLKEECKLLPKSSWTRTLYSRPQPRDNKRYKAIAKQVVGGAFCGFIDREAELHIADMLVHQSKRLAFVGADDKTKKDRIKSSTDLIFDEVKPYLLREVESYISTIVKRLLDTEVALRWHERKNSCQTFCDNMIDTKTFGSLFAPSQGTTNSTPRYLMSFVCRSSAYISRGPGPIYKTPHGHMEEYLMRYRFGRHDESDIIDTLQEYWYDWGNFEGTLYNNQDIFPWDCTEGFNKNSHRCSECNISRHVWAFAYDSMSLISLHLSRARHFYPQTSDPKKPGPRGAAINTTARKIGAEKFGFMLDSEWFHNRLRVLMAQYSLLVGAAAMAQCPRVRQDSSWIMNEGVDEYIDRIKLGGIIRAQPFSHHFEKGSYNVYYVSGWTSLELRERIKAYEKIRDERALRGGGLPGLVAWRARVNERTMRIRGEGGGHSNEPAMAPDTATDDFPESSVADIHTLSLQTQHPDPVGGVHMYEWSGGGGGGGGGGCSGNKDNGDSGGGFDGGF